MTDKVVTLRPGKQPVEQGVINEREWELKRKHHLLQMHMRDMVRMFGLEVTKDTIKSSKNDGVIMKLSSIGERQDGLNPSHTALDEILEATRCADDPATGPHLPQRAGSETRRACGPLRAREGCGMIKALDVETTGLNPETDAATLIILHALISGGASPSEKTIDEAIKGGELLKKKLEAANPREKDFDDDEDEEPAAKKTKAVKEPKEPRERSTRPG